MFYENSNAGKAKLNKVYSVAIIVSKFYYNKHFMAIAMMAELNKMVFNAAPRLRQGWAEAKRRRQSCLSLAAKAEDATGDSTLNCLLETLFFPAEF